MHTESKMCTIGDVLPYTCLLPGIVLYFNIANRSFSIEGNGNQDMSMSEITMDTNTNCIAPEAAALRIKIVFPCT